jgi:hypothetical protein
MSYADGSPELELELALTAEELEEDTDDEHGELRWAASPSNWGPCCPRARALDMSTERNISGSGAGTRARPRSRSRRA